MGGYGDTRIEESSVQKPCIYDREVGRIHVQEQSEARTRTIQV